MKDATMLLIANAHVTAGRSERDAAAEQPDTNRLAGLSLTYGIAHGAPTALAPRYDGTHMAREK